MRVSEDYAGKTTSAKWLATTLRNYNKPNLVATIESVRKHQFDAKRWMPLLTTRTHSLLPTNLGDDASGWPGNKVVLSTAYGQTPSGMGHIMQMRGVLTGHQAVSNAAPATEPVKANGADNAYAAASQPANGQPPKQGSASASLDDEIPF